MTDADLILALRQRGWTDCADAIEAGRRLERDNPDTQAILQATVDTLQSVIDDCHRVLDDAGVPPARGCVCSEPGCESQLGHRVRALVRQKS